MAHEALGALASVVLARGTLQAPLAPLAPSTHPVGLCFPSESSAFPFLFVGLSFRVKPHLRCRFLQETTFHPEV